MPFAHLMFTTPAAGPATPPPGLAAALAELIATRLRKPAGLVALRIEPVAPAQWSVGGAALAAGQSGAHLQVWVTAGSNSAAEMADFIAAAHALLQRELGALHPASYVAVQELAASAWGWSGRTQDSRRREREAAAPAAAQIGISV